MSTPSDHLDRILERLTREWLNGSVHYDFWRRLNSLAKDEPDLVAVAPEFFESTSYAHIDAAVVRLNRLFDTSKGAVSVYELIKYAHKHPEAFREGSPAEVSDAVREAEKAISESKDLLDRFRRQRNGYFAHIAGEYFHTGRSVTDEHPVRYSDVIEVLNLVGRVVNIFLAPHEDSELLPEVIGVDYAFEGLRDCLRRGVDSDDDS